MGKPMPNERDASLAADRRLRVLLITEAANPEWASVPLIGWSQAQALRRLTDAHVVTQIRNRDAFLRAGMAEGRDFTAIDNEYVARPLYRLSSLLRGGAGVGWTTVAALSSIAYYAFEFEVWRLFGARLRAGEFDLVHRITPVSPTSQSLLAERLSKAGVPFVIGPLNGGVPWPKGFRRRQHAEKEWLAHVRQIYALMPYYRSTRRFGTVLLVGSRHTLAQMPDWAKSKCVYLPENGVDPARFGHVRSRHASVPLRAAFVGRLVPYKGADMLIEAAARALSDGLLTLDIVGDGPERQRLETMVDGKGLRQRVTFHGWVPHPEVQNVLTECDFLALPSVREFGGGVVLEAMALGVTPVVADYAGPSELVDDDTGIRVPFHDQASLIEGFERTIGSLIRTPQRLDVLGAAARERALRDFTWEAKARRLVALYETLIATAKAGR
jgi:glycosyltransferase involved in cell wall biosynthesis